ncbi:MULTISPECIES: hypothetical protein [Phenylobacterium]|uniref:PH domain-containing protein n=1 Tax=Phenylobacterium conjunctum TaxID=1298959 RepID=A0ABW3T3P6_9CAUL
MRHAARLSPLQAETVWTLEDGAIVETRGAHVRRLALAELKSLKITPQGAALGFGLRRLVIPARTYGGGLKPLDATDTYAPFAEALAEACVHAAPAARQRAGAPGRAEPVIWIMALMGGGAAALLVFAALAGDFALGVALASRLLFVTILAGAVLPWLGRPRTT